MNKILAAFGLGVLMWVAPAGAQTSTMRFDIPFSFVAGDHVLPAGTYRVTVDDNFNLCRLDPFGGTSPHIVRLVPGATSRPMAKSLNGSMRFTRYGDRYVFSGVWRPDSVAGNETVQSRHQRELAASGTTPVVVSLSAGLK